MIVLAATLEKSTYLVELVPAGLMVVLGRECALGP